MTTRCDWADPDTRSTRCERPGAVLEDGWHHCPAHLAVHRSLTDQRVCGTKAGYERHRYHGTPACHECIEARKAYDRVKWAKRAAKKKQQQQQDVA